jgi:hypothetical protein
MNATQELAQKVCQRYGWSAAFDTDDKGQWTCTVQLSPSVTEQHTFVSESAGLDRKQGIAAASQAAIHGLQDLIAAEEAKPFRELTDIFPNPITIYESNDENWQSFWKNKPSVVGVDTEGNQIRPPVLVQIATEHFTIIEAPQNGQLSAHLNRLLRDETIVKVVCDNFAHNDKMSLGIHTQSDTYDSNNNASIVDLEAIASKLLGPTKVPRGLSRILNFSMPDVRIGKATNKLKYVSRFCWIEQGKQPRLSSIYDLSPEELQYAALDAWCTLQAYKCLQTYL